MMNNDRHVRPYFKRIKNWKIRNMVVGYLSARSRFRHLLEGRNDSADSETNAWLSFEEMKEISDILFELKEDQHLIYRRLIDPQRNVFEDSHKFQPDEVAIAFMNNVGLIFHKVMVARELDYILEHYVEHMIIFQDNKVNLETLLQEIDELFEEGVDILGRFILANSDNPLLLTMLLEHKTMVRRHFGPEADRIVLSFATNGGLDEAYYKAGRYYYECGRPAAAGEMLKAALQQNPDHGKARTLQVSLVR
jgi:tetratricopeptide (TPR) repeat protein